MNFISQNWENGASFNAEDFQNERLLWGWMPLYPTFILIGIILAVVASIVKLRIKKIPLTDFRRSIYIIIPIGILGASFFGKFSASQNFNWKIWELFYFWQPGMHLYGGLIFGVFAGYTWFMFKTRRSKISMWTYAEAIVPNILLAQSIGRWGNLFNREILGRPVSVEKINWLPEFIWHKLFYLVDPLTAEKLTTIQFREPLFLYESGINLLIWILLTFVVANFGRWFSKKPWKFEKDTYPCIFNNDLKSIKLNNLNESNDLLYTPVRYKTLKNGEVRYSLYNVWNKAYYYRNVDKNLLEEYRINEIKKEQESQNNSKKLIKLKDSLKREISEQNNKYLKTKITKIQLKSNIKQIKGKYCSEIKIYKRKTNMLLNFIKKDSSIIYNLNNVHSYFVIHSGFNAGLSIALYTILRIFLETRRNPWEMAVRMNVAFNYIFLSVILLIGITLFVFAQFIAPKKWRKEGWLYEKSY